MGGDQDELLFSYGALQSEDLQRTTFGRVVASEPDVLPGYTTDYIEVVDRRFSDRTGLDAHPILRPTGNPHDLVVGIVLHLTADEVDAADEFEVTMFRRARVTLRSGRDAWVYVAA